MARGIGLAAAAAMTALFIGPLVPPLTAQNRIPIDLGPDDTVQGSGPPETIDILRSPKNPDRPTPAQAKECDDSVDASAITGEIVVCGAKQIDNSDRFAGSHADWLEDYAERSKNYNAPGTPDVGGAGIFRGEPSVSGLCFIPPCPNPPAILVDVEALPPPPVGSDADRQANGLPPRGKGGEYTVEERRRIEAELDLPPKPDFTAEGDESVVTQSPEG